MKFIYDVGILIVTFLIRLAVPFNSKARLWVEGRRNWKAQLKEKVNRRDKNIWVHCASLGEFEQGRPVIEMIKKEGPEFKIILTFFSPSGYEVRKNYPLADYVCYLPADTPGNASEFVSGVNPAFVIFVKYEFWNNYILTLSERDIPIYLISGIFRQDQYFFKCYGTFFRKTLSGFRYFFVQDRQSMELLSAIGYRNVEVSGDTRFDRVLQIAAEATDIPQLELFRGGEKLFLAGSSWPQDEEIIARYVNSFPGKMKWVFAPHEIDSGNIERLEKLFTTSVVRFSEFNESSAGARVMIMDNIGMLSSAYRYAFIAEVGGGFGKGIHNILEAACWGVPVLFGPDFEKFMEAVDLVMLGGAKCFHSYGEFSAIIETWISDQPLYMKSAETALSYVKQNSGATEIIMKKLFAEDVNNAD